MHEPSTPSPYTVLVVDDDALIAMSTADMLEDLGHAVIECHSGRQALDILCSGVAVDLMITDYAMPGMNGVELAERALQQNSALPILLATGYSDLPSATTLSLKRIAKPYLQADLQAEIDRLRERV